MMNFWDEIEEQLRDVEPEPGWSGLYDPWNGRRREQTPFDLFPQSELYYSTELSDYEDDDYTPGQQEDAQEERSEHEVYLRSSSPPLRGLSPIWGPSPSRIPSPSRSRAPLKRPASSQSPSPSMPPASRRRVHFNTSVTVFGQPSVAGYMRVPLHCQGIWRLKDEGDNHKVAPPSRSTVQILMRRKSL